MLQCSHINGSCTCAAGYRGRLCDSLCAPGYYGVGCQKVGLVVAKASAYLHISLAQQILTSKQTDK